MPLRLHNRVQSIAAVSLLLGLAHTLWPDPGERSAWIYRCVTTFGYGHLIGAAWFGRRLFGTLRPPPVSPILWRAFVLTTVAVLLGVYSWSLHRAPGLILFFFGVSAWHIAENDLALGQAYRNGGRLPGLSRPWSGHLRALGVTSIVVVAGLATPELGWTPLMGFPWSGPSLSDVFAAVTGYHLVSWVRFIIDRTRWSDDTSARRQRRDLIAVHVLPLAACLALLEIGERAAPIEALVFGPGIYLFWSVLHVLQTAVTRTRRLA
ncbi:MAG: hypothetical protein JRH01_04175 [Deltaproteobacteria bacterium]|nr:hypothetical protein [Deltaproteobacteria bacterium]MBW2395396.1 hypothetical protein [Deltaproteobacteria bacterium]